LIACLLKLQQSPVTQPQGLERWERGRTAAPWHPFEVSAKRWLLRGYTHVHVANMPTRSPQGWGQGFLTSYREGATKYIYTDDDSQGRQLNGQNAYAVTFAKGQVPPVKGFWSLTLYNEEHFFHPNPLNRYSLGTKNKNLKYNVDGSLTIYAGAKSPGTRRRVLALHPCHWAEKAIIDGSWTPPAIARFEGGSRALQ
jgi:hypothetical protein